MDHRDHGGQTPKSRLQLILILTLTFMVVEAVVGFIANSLALLADAGHMLNDVLSLFLAIIALSLSSMKSTRKFTFGFKRVEVLSGLANGVSLIVIAYLIVAEAVRRFGNLSSLEVQGGLVTITALIGLGVNLVGVKLLSSSKEESINVEGAYEHIIADVAGSVAALVTGIGIYLFNATWLDIVASIAVSLLVLKSGVSITLRTLKILIQATPDEINIEKVEEDIMDLEGVRDVHDIHAWRVTDGMDVLTAHITVNNVSNIHPVKLQARKIARESGFHHTTLQVECECDEETFNCL